jgi:hypothetical protein
VLDVTADVNADDSNGFSITVSASDTESLPAGKYEFLARVSNSDGEKWGVDSGVLIVEPNVETAAAGDLQSFAEQMVEALEAALLANASGTSGTGGLVLSYTIANRSVTFRDEAHLRAQLSHYRWKVWQERNPGQLGPRRSVKFIG